MLRVNVFTRFEIRFYKTTSDAVIPLWIVITEHIVLVELKIGAKPPLGEVEFK